MHHVFSAYEPAEERDLIVAPHGSLVAFEDGVSTGYAIFMTQETRGHVHRARHRRLPRDGRGPEQTEMKTSM